MIVCIIFTLMPPLGVFTFKFWLEVVSLFQLVTVTERVPNVTSILSCIVPLVMEVTAATVLTIWMGRTASDAWITTTETPPASAVSPAAATLLVRNKTYWPAQGGRCIKKHGFILFYFVFCIVFCLVFLFCLLFFNFIILFWCKFERAPRTWLCNRLFYWFFVYRFSQYPVWQHWQM